MRTLTQQEVFFALKYAKSIPENEGAIMLTRFQTDYPELCSMVFGGLPQAVASQNQDMANLFMDLCFDILCVYTRAQGDLPKGIADHEWLCTKMASLQTEIMALQKEHPAHKNANHVGTENVQTALLEYLAMAIQEYTEGDPAKEAASAVTTNLLFVITRLFDAIYDEALKTRH